jgi:ribosomal protein S18 acetylase RimI-like enzyme
MSPASARSAPFRDHVLPGDPAAVRRIVESTGFFRPDEVAVAAELVETRLRDGEGSGYFFLFAAEGAETVGYACYGPIACTIGSYDLFWIAVDRDHQGRGLGRRLLDEVERRIRDAGGRRVYIETSAQERYEPTRAFYRRCGYRVEATLAGFYAEGDDKVIFCRALA